MIGPQYEEFLKLIEQRLKDQQAEPEKTKIQLIGRRKRK